MKLRITLLLIFTVLFFSCKQTGTRHGSISGNFTHAKNTIVLFQKVTPDGEITLDSTKTDGNGNFSLANKANETEYYLVRTAPAKVIFLLLNGKEDVKLTGDNNNLETTYDVEGSVDSKNIRELRQYENKLADSLNTVYVDFRDKFPLQKDSMGKELQQVYAHRMEAFSIDFVRRNIHSLAALSATKYISQENQLPLMDSLSGALKKEFHDNKYLVDFESILSDLKKNPPGSMAPDIKLATPEGKELSLSSFRGKVVLVDFWASWCGPCRAENPAVVKMYEKYKRRGFEIYGVSLDDNIAAWKEATRKDGITWPQVSDLKKWNSVVVGEYHIEAIPYSVLVGKDGKIIAKGLHGEELSKKIFEAL